MHYIIEIKRSDHVKRHITDRTMSDEIKSVDTLTLLPPDYLSLFLSAEGMPGGTHTFAHPCHQSRDG